MADSDARRRLEAASQRVVELRDNFKTQARWAEQSRDHKGEAPKFQQTADYLDVILAALPPRRSALNLTESQIHGVGTLVGEAVEKWSSSAAEPPPSLVAAFNPDWSLLKATQESLREHMALLAGYNTLVALVREWQEATLAYRAASEAFQDAVRSRSAAAEDRVATAAYHRMVAAENELLAFPRAAARDAEPAKCVIGEYCRLHDFIHGEEANELRDRLEKLDIPAVNRVLEDVDARDSCALVEAERAAAERPEKD